MRGIERPGQASKLRTFSDKHRVLRLSLHDTREERRSPQQDKQERNNQVYEKQGFRRYTKRRHKKEKKRGYGHIYYLCDKQSCGERAAREDDRPLVESGNKEDRYPRGEQEYKRDEVREEKRAGRRHELAQCERQPKRKREKDYVPQKKHYRPGAEYSGHLHAIIKQMREITSNKADALVGSPTERRGKMSNKKKEPPANFSCCYRKNLRGGSRRQEGQALKFRSYFRAEANPRKSSRRSTQRL